jgi:sulfhydrogenase subunit beta (sulfur reductase)
MAASRRLEAAGLEALFGALRRRGYTVVGPRLHDGAIVYDELGGADDLPIGWTEVQDAGSYRVVRRSDAARFGYTVGPHAWKRFLHPPALRLWRAERDAEGAFELLDEPHEPPRYAFVGVRPCDVAAIAIQDRVFTGGAHVDHDYEARRRAAFVVAVHCTEPGGTCFCASMETGPRATKGFDLALTEIVPAGGGEPSYLLETGSERGAELLPELGGRPARDDEVADADRRLTEAAHHMGRTLDTRGLAEALRRSLDNSRWEEPAARCLACGNCTMSCPTCFCNTVEDTTDLTGAFAERTRRWDSCFTLDLSYVHGGPVRASMKSRYRQWATHKLATWVEQFGTAGCVGCGRCITWCPAAIDLTEEAALIAASEARSTRRQARRVLPAASAAPGKEAGDVVAHR